MFFEIDFIKCYNCDYNLKIWLHYDIYIVVFRYIIYVFKVINFFQLLWGRVFLHIIIF